MKKVVITDSNVEALYRHLCTGMHVLAFPPGEASKTRDTLLFLEDGLEQLGCGKETWIIGLGGGVVTDIAGFLAATFCRGVPLVLVPTTLLAMVDASIGGKNGLNTALGKNRIGTIYHPTQVIYSSTFLKTLPETEIAQGKVEMLKALILHNPEALSLPFNQQIGAAIETKRRIVALDPEERGVRRILNWGHTVAHALEKTSNYTLSHGTAVSMGIVIESDISYRLGILDTDSWFQIQDLFPRPHLSQTPKALIEAMRGDKKVKEDQIRLVLLRKLGSVEPFNGAFCAPVSEPILEEVLHDYAGSPCLL